MGGNVRRTLKRPIYLRQELPNTPFTGHTAPPPETPHVHATLQIRVPDKNPVAGALEAIFRDNQTTTP